MNVLVVIDSRYEPDHHMWRGLYCLAEPQTGGVFINGQPLPGRLWTSAGLNCTRDGAERQARGMAQWALNGEGGRLATW